MSSTKSTFARVWSGASMCQPSNTTPTSATPASMTAQTRILVSPDMSTPALTTAPS